jgi:molybdate transport system permease protein
VKDVWRKDKFNLVMVAVAYLTLFSIVAVIVTVMIRGFPHIGKSLASREIQFAIRLSLYTSLISTSFCIVIAVPVAYALARADIPMKSLFNTLLDLPLAFPPLVSGLCLLLFFGTTPFGAWLEKIVIPIVFTVKGIIIAQIFVNLPFMIRVMKTTILAINPRLEFTARTLGCTPAQAFWKITLPLSKNGIIAGTVITWARALGEFGAALMLAGATRFRTETLPMSLFLNMSTGNLGEAMAAANLLIFISIVSLYIFNKFGGDFIGGTRGV